MRPTGGPSPLRAEIWKASAVSPQQILRENQEHWSAKLQLNRTGKPADPEQKVKDDYDRAFLPSVPVLHMDHALDDCMRRHGPKIEGWADREPLTAMLLNAEFWIDEALELAEHWRKGPHIPGKVTLTESDMIAIVR